MRHANTVYKQEHAAPRFYGNEECLAAANTMRRDDA